MKSITFQFNTVLQFQDDSISESYFNVREKGDKKPIPYSGNTKHEICHSNDVISLYSRVSIISTGSIKHTG